MKNTQNQKEQRMRPSVLRLALLGVLLIMIVGLAVTLPQEQAPAQPHAAAPVPTQGPTAAPADAGRSAREAAYDKDVEALRALADDARLDDDIRTQAAERLAMLLNDHQSELGVEAALEAAGLAPCFVLVHNGAVTVVLPGRDVSDDISAAILGICTAHTDIGAENIRIMSGTLSRAGWDG